MVSHDFGGFAVPGLCPKLINSSVELHSRQRHSIDERLPRRKVDRRRWIFGRADLPSGHP